MSKSGLVSGALILSVLIGTAAVLRPAIFASKDASFRQQAAKALSREEWQRSLELAQQALKLDPVNSEAAAIAGIACARQQKITEALAYLTSVSSTSGTTNLAVQRELARRAYRSGDLQAAEQFYRNAITLNPDDLESNRRLAEILTFEGRCDEAAPHLLTQIRHGIFLADELYLLGIPHEISVKNAELTARSLENFPRDPLAELGSTRALVGDHKHAAAEPILRRIVDRYPHVALAQALLGRIFVEQFRAEECVRWHESLPAEVGDSPQIWFVRAMWAQQTGQTEAAVRCLLETLQQDPSHVEANYQLSQLFQRLGDVEHAEFFSNRSLLLSRLGYVVNDLRGEPNLRLMQQAIDGLEQLGRHWEAVAWCHLANNWGGEDWAQQRLRNNRSQANRDVGQVISAANPVQQFRIDDFQLPVWEIPQTSGGPATSSVAPDTIRFRDVAAETGLSFTYFNSMDEKVGLEHIFQTTGGGIGVLDFDGDLWPDVYLSNGNILPDSVTGINEPQTFHLDALYRNRRGLSFTNVTETASLGDDRFSQGVTAGDYDNDGFQDIFVSNVGRNRLYHNNGDGTFSEIVESGATDSSVWTMSAMIADIDADGLSDIYAVNYLDMAEVFDRSCKKGGEPLTCAPTLFTAEQDRLYRNLGDGTFEDVTQAYGISAPNGKGLGIVGLQVTGKKGLQLFIANDTTENLYYESEATESGETRYRENAVLAGVAMSETGDMQACMGVAAGDVNQDGNIDLFITNFFADSNTMYLQTIPGTFTDSTRNCALAEPSYGRVGFGTQFLDANLDGQLDLIVTNGHVDQTFATGEPDRMSPQFFLNVANGRFAEQPAESLGPFFEEKFFGRSLARLDWNRDAKDDACILHLSAPVALLANETETSNRAIVLHLRGTRSSRDAVGAVVTLETDRGTYVRQLTAGDGYQASNEKKIIFGLPLGTVVVAMRMRWLDGTEFTIDADFAETAELIVVENKGVFSL